MNFNWKYGLINNIPFLFLLIALYLQHSFTQIIEIPHYLLFLISLVVGLYLLYYFSWERPFIRKHPEYKSSNRKISRLGWTITAIGLGLMLVLIGFSDPNSYPFIWSVLTLTLFVRDSLSLQI
ncbi:hypothetical protein [Liquorilactobacillus uvarum]|uniref:hypothetical protein n=1 Tax=Liquorilactobacillus uvarum TaxID=303240 RepID=UPI00070E74FD|nr:hypothetical protein [Liquorilactobacillus uvarum]